MATISYTFNRRCDGGGHTAFDISVNGGASNTVVFPTDDIRAPLSDMTADERATFLAGVLRVHFAGRSRAQIVTELQAGPVSVTI